MQNRRDSIKNMYKQVKMSLYNSHCQRLLSLLKSQAEVVVFGEWTKSIPGDSFLLVDNGSGDKKLIIFNNNNFKILCDSRWNTPDMPTHAFYQIMHFSIASKFHWFMSFYQRNSELFERMLRLTKGTLNLAANIIS